MSKINLNPKDFVHIPEKSRYNYNFYKTKEIECCREILEICHEDYDFFEYEIVYGNEKILLGCSESRSGLGGDNLVVIDFLRYYS